MSASLNSNDNASSEDLFFAMKTLSAKVTAFNPRLNLMGSKVEHKETFSIYDSMPQLAKNKIFTDFMVYADLLTSSIDFAAHKNRDRSLTWGALKCLRLKFDENLFENLLDTDIVEIYRNDNLQVFRNLKFHEVCSFHFPELFIKQWPDLFQRDPFVTKQIMSSAIAAFTSEDCGKIDTDHIPEHDLIEISSPENLSMKMQLKSLYPLLDQNNNASYILAVSRVKLKDKRKIIDYDNVYSI